MEPMSAAPLCAVAYICACDALCPLLQAEAAIGFFEEMRMRGIERDTAAYSKLIEVLPPPPPPPPCPTHTATACHSNDTHFLPVLLQPDPGVLYSAPRQPPFVTSLAQVVTVAPGGVQLALSLCHTAYGMGDIDMDTYRHTLLRVWELGYGADSVLAAMRMKSDAALEPAPPGSAN